ncbi:hypothetical protein ACHAP7_004327 [Fusarium lateritium]
MPFLDEQPLISLPPTTSDMFFLLSEFKHLIERLWAGEQERHNIANEVERLTSQNNRRLIHKVALVSQRAQIYRAQHNLEEEFGTGPQYVARKTTLGQAIHRISGTIDQLSELDDKASETQDALTQEYEECITRGYKLQVDTMDLDLTT